MYCLYIQFPTFVFISLFLSHTGVQEVNRVSDKQCHYILKQAYKTKQVCLYQSSPDSLLYREMLTFKATHSSPHTTTGLQLPDDDSDSEYMTGGGEHYDGDSESSYFTEEDKDRESSSSPFQILKGAVVSDKPDDMLDDVEVGYYSTRRVSSPSEDMPTSKLQLFVCLVYTFIVRYYNYCTHCETIHVLSVYTMSL